MKKSEKNILYKLRSGDITAYKYFFNTYYKDLYDFSRKYLNNKEVAEEIVQDVFIYLWNNINKIDINISLKSYLYTSVKNRSLNYIKSKYNRIEHVELDETGDNNIGLTANEMVEYKELEKLINLAVEALPNRCKDIFYLSRNSEMSYQEIADELNISKDTVKLQIKIAIKKLKEYLKDHWEYIPS